jgi:hypothetical protein
MWSSCEAHDVFYGCAPTFVVEKTMVLRCTIFWPHNFMVLGMLDLLTMGKTSCQWPWRLALSRHAFGHNVHRAQHRRSSTRFAIAPSFVKRKCCITNVNLYLFRYHNRLSCSICLSIAFFKTNSLVNESFQLFSIQIVRYNALFYNAWVGLLD